MAYEKFFGLQDAPFRLTPDPDYYFPSDVHKEALQTLLYSIRAGEGFVQITGHPGTGKTLLLRTILRQLGDEVTTALILNPKLSPQELLRVILEDLGLDPLQMEKRPKEELLRYFRDFLLGKAQKGQKTVIIIDEAQNLPNDTMEELRLLSNLETEKEKLLQIILVGQVELEKKLQSDELKQLNQRITIRYRLKPLNKNDTIAYIYHRIRIAGGGEHIRFTPMVLSKIYKLSKGIPRLINIICERALMAAYVEGKNTIEKNQVKKAMESIVGEEELEPAQPLIRPVPVMIAILLLLFAAVGLGFWFFPFSQQKTSVIHAIPEAEKAALAEKEAKIREKEVILHQTEEMLREKKADLSQKEKIVRSKVSSIGQKEDVLGKKEEELSDKELTLRKKEEELRRREAHLDKEKVGVSKREEILSGKEVDLRKKEASLSQKEEVISKKEKDLAQEKEVLGKKEIALRKEETVLAKKQPVSLPQDITTPSLRPFPPPEAFNVPKNKFFIALNCDIQRAFILQGSETEPLLKAEFECEWPLGEGLFILGKDASRGAFVFHHMSFLWGRPYVMPTNLWGKVSELVSGNAVPLIAYSSKTTVNAPMIEKAREMEHIIGSWSDTWRNMEVDKLMNYYGDIFTIYYMNMEKPILFSKDQFYQYKKDILLRSGFVSLKTSDPIYIIDPGNPRMAIAFFYQEYRSEIYADVGTKALYFSLVDEPGGKQTWKIIAKVWVPTG